MSEHNFTIVLSGDVDGHIDELYEAGLDDATIGETNGIPYAEFDREAPTRVQAIMSALNDIRKVEGVYAVRIEPEELVTAAEIAERIGKSREAIRLLASGQRGRGDFPQPVSHLRFRSPLWRLPDVLAWTSSDPAEIEESRILAYVNARLQTEHLRRELRGAEIRWPEVFRPASTDESSDLLEILKEQLLTEVTSSIERVLPDVQSGERQSPTARRGRRSVSR
jgi:hypothetical protein